MNDTRTHTIVVLGGGFGSLEFCRCFRHSKVRIILVDRQNHRLFQPLLYQVATAGLAMSAIAKPLRSATALHRLADCASSITVVMRMGQLSRCCDG